MPRRTYNRTNTLIDLDIDGRHISFTTHQTFIHLQADESSSLGGSSIDRDALCTQICPSLLNFLQSKASISALSYSVDCSRQRAPSPERAERTHLHQRSMSSLAFSKRQHSPAELP